MFSVFPFNNLDALTFILNELGWTGTLMLIAGATLAAGIALVATMNGFAWLLELAADRLENAALHTFAAVDLAQQATDRFTEEPPCPAPNADGTLTKGELYPNGHPTDFMGYDGANEPLPPQISRKRAA